MQRNTYKKISLATLTNLAIPLTSNTKRYKITGNKSVVSIYTITPTGTPTEGMSVLFDYLPGTVTADRANYLSGSVGIQIFGATLPYQFIAKDCKIWCEYTNAAWEVFILPSLKDLNVLGTDSLDTTIWDDNTIEYDSTTNTVRVKDSGITHAKIADDAIEDNNIKNGEVTLTKMADITRGSVIVGGTDDAPTLLDVKTSGQLVIGDGTDVKSVAMSGDTTISAAGVVAIGAAKILSAMIKAGELVNDHINAAAAIVFTKMAALTASKVPVLNSSGFIEAGAVDASKLTYIDVTPGTSAVSKAVVLDASGKIDTVDITSLKIGGVSVTATGAEINYLSGVTSSVQDQIDAATTKLTMTTITANTIATVATLKQLYIADTSAGSVDLTLPKADTVSEGVTVRLLQVGSNAASVKANAADTLLDVDDLSTDQSSIACTATGKSITLICNGVDTWQCIQKDYVYVAP